MEKKKEYPPFTIIMRGYTADQADTIVQAVQGFEKYFAVEVTLNTKNALSIIQTLTEKYGHEIQIGAGTVRNLADAQAAVENGAQFLLSPHKFTADIFEFCQAKNIVTVPAAMTASEVNDSFLAGADIVKIFPAAVVTPRFFTDIQAPLGKLPLMAVGGINEENVGTFLSGGASYAGIGSSMFDREDIKNKNMSALASTLERYVRIAERI